MKITNVSVVRVLSALAVAALLASCGGDGDGDDGTQQEPPAVSTLGAEMVSQTTETLRGSVDPRGAEAEYWFEWGTDAPLATPNATPIRVLAASSGEQPVTEEVTGLQKGATIYYRLCARNAGGTVTVPGAVKSCHHYANVVFVTSAKGTGRLASWPEAGGAAGLEAGDAICRALAERAELRGDFKAWLSDSTVRAYDRLAHSEAAYVRVDGVKVADDWKDLTSATGSAYLANPISTDEQGATVLSTSVWTDTRVSGDHTAAHFVNDNACRDWQSTDVADWAAFGHSGAVDYTWTETPGNQCNNLSSLFCVQQDFALPQEPFSTGKAGPWGWVWHVSACSDGVYQDPDCVYVCSNFYSGTGNCNTIPANFGGYTVNSCFYNTGLYSMSATYAGHSFTVTCELL